MLTTVYGKLNYAGNAGNGSRVVLRQLASDGASNGLFFSYQHGQATIGFGS